MGRKPLRRSRAGAALAALALLISGCEPLAITALGVGSSTAVSHTLGGITYRTFSAPMTRVKTASIQALNGMGMKLARLDRDQGTEIVKATARDREIEIQLEPLATNATRMRVVARNGGLFYDSATAIEIILQTEKILSRV